MQNSHDFTIHVVVFTNFTFNCPSLNSSLVLRSWLIENNYVCVCVKGEYVCVHNQPSLGRTRGWMPERNVFKTYQMRRALIYLLQLSKQNTHMEGLKGTGY